MLADFRCLISRIGLFGLFLISTTSLAKQEDSLFIKVDAWLKRNGKSFQLLKTATETIGHRLTGSPNGALAESFVFEQLTKGGLEEVKFEPFQFKALSDL
jgi:hypothetical protein